MKSSAYRISYYLITFSLLTLMQFALRAETAKTFGKYQIEQVLGDLNFPSSLVFIDHQQFLIAQRDGVLKLFSNGELSTAITGLPEDLLFAGQGGLLDIALHPDYASNGWLYLSYAAGTPKNNNLSVLRGKLNGTSLENIEVLFTVSPSKDTPVHYGAKMAFLPDNSLLISSGDGFDYRESAQKLDSLLGKIVRINDDGSVPKNNPYSGQSRTDVSDWIFSLGHRNPQGLIYDSVRKMIFSNEHGPAGGDEINIIHPGGNYGWPVITQGMDYIGARISPFTEYPGMEPPFVDWTPSIAPSSLAVYYGKMFPELHGDLLSSTLVTREVRWVQMQKQSVIGQVSLFSELKQRIRDVRVHPDGSIYLLIDGQQGSIQRVFRE